jgi:hypothetical protein
MAASGLDPCPVFMCRHFLPTNHTRLRQKKWEGTCPGLEAAAHPDLRWRHERLEFLEWGEEGTGRGS